MNISEKGVEFIGSFEGYHRALPSGDCTTYYCPAGVLTIGFGVTEGIRPGEIWTRKQALDRFRGELAKHEAAVNRCVTIDMTQHQFDALVSFSYNLGAGALAQSSIVRNLNAGNAQAAARCFAPYCNARVGGRLQSLPGLVRRRAAEAAMFLQPDIPSVEPDMPQKVEIPAQKPKGSRKAATADVGMIGAGTTGLGLTSLSAGESIGYAQQAAQFVKEHGVELALTFAVIAAIIFAALKYFQQQDYAEGRYVPREADE